MRQYKHDDGDKLVMRQYGVCGRYLVSESGWHTPKKQQKTTPDRDTDFERIWQDGLSQCIRWRLADEQYRAALTDVVLCGEQGVRPATLRIASKLQNHFAFLTYCVVGRFAADNGFDAEERHDLWRWAWERLFNLLVVHPTMPDWLIELALEDGIARLIENTPASVEPVPPELETPLAAVLAKESLEWDILARRLDDQSERTIAAGIGKSKTDVNRNLDRMRKRAKRMGAMP